MATNASDNGPSNFGNIFNNAPSSDQVAQGISDTAANAREGFNNVVSDFSSGNVMNASNEFLESNGMLAKTVFVILILCVFLVFLNLGMWLIKYLVGPKRSPYLVDGLLNGGQEMVVSQDPADSSSLVVYRSNNENGGMEFTWSVWLQVLAMPKDATKHNTIFVKGSANDSTAYDDTSGKVKVNNGPGLYLRRNAASTTATDAQPNCILSLVMDVVGPDSSSSGSGQTASKVVDIPNFPIGKWTHVAYRLQNKMMDCYVNGIVAQHISFDNLIPKQNYDNVYLCGNGGFPGNLSNLRYYDHALAVSEINTVVYYGPNLKTAKGAGNNENSDFLSSQWYKYD
jgi:hypothetical protein